MALVESVQEVFAPGGMLARADARFVPREGQTQMAMAVALRNLSNSINKPIRNSAFNAAPLYFMVSLSLSLSILFVFEFN